MCKCLGIYEIGFYDVLPATWPSPSNQRLCLTTGGALSFLHPPPTTLLMEEALHSVPSCLAPITRLWPLKCRSTLWYRQWQSNEGNYVLCWWWILMSVCVVCRDMCRVQGVQEGDWLSVQIHEYLWECVWFVEICAVSKVSKKEIGRVFKLILKNLETSVELITTGDFMVCLR